MGLSDKKWQARYDRESRPGVRRERKPRRRRNGNDGDTTSGVCCVDVCVLSPENTVRLGVYVRLVFISNPSRKLILCSKACNCTERANLCVFQEVEGNHGRH